MIKRIENEQIEKALKEVAVLKKVFTILRGVEDPVKRARVLRMVQTHYGYDE